MKATLRISEALEVIPEKGHPSNAQIIAECIRQELELCRGDTAGAAEHRIANMLLSDFVHAKVVSPFRLIDREQFSRWTVTVQYPVGEPMLIMQDS